jgi:hypothetical protein
MFSLRSFIVALLGTSVYVVSATTMPALSPGLSKVGQLEAKDIEESSGLVASRRHPGILYTHNDSGGAPVLYAIRADGSLVKQYRVPAKHTDWEDVATDDAGRLYIANTGNNNVQRDSVEVFRVAEPNLGERAITRKSKAKVKDTRKDETRLRVERTWKLKFPGQPFNCESLFIFRNHGYLVSKMSIGERAGIFRFPLDESTTDLTLEKVADLSIRKPVTGADLSADGKRLALVTSGVGATLYLYDLTGDVATAEKIEPKQIPLPPKKIEAVAFTQEGILMTAESREMYRYSE